MTTTETEVAQRIRSPRSAVIAGIVFSILMIMQMVILNALNTENPASITLGMLEEWSGAVSFALGSVPFAGIALLWFTGVIRDWLGDREDRFFATIFLGSGIIFVALLFIYSAILGAIFSYALADLWDADSNILIFGFVLINQILGSYLLRIAGVYMLSIGSLLNKAEHGPRWLTILTTILALGFLFFAGTFRELRYIFPIWVFVVSIYILISYYRYKE